MIATQSSPCKTLSPEISLGSGQCPLCAGTAGELTYAGYDQDYHSVSNQFTFMKCAHDGHWFLKDWPTLSDFPLLYQEYQTHNQASPYHAPSFIRQIKNHFFDRLRLRPLQGKNQQARFLEVGAGEGHTSKLLRQMYPQAYICALDLNFSAQTKKELTALNISWLESSWENYASPLFFDGIIASHFIEHIHYPQRFLTWAYAHLQKEGLLYLETPDQNALCARLFGRYWGMLHFPRHLHLFDQKNLQQLVHQSNFQLRRSGHHTSAAAWLMSLRNLQKKDAIKQGPGWRDWFHYSNFFLLSFFTMLDFLLLSFGLATSSQYLWAQKR